MNAIEKLKIERPDLAVKVRWTLDEFFTWDGDGPDPEEEGLFPHDVDVLVFAIVNGELLKSRASLGGCYSPLNGPHDVDIDYYLDQLLDGAVSDIDKTLARFKP